jgi:hypothetical protein
MVFKICIFDCKAFSLAKRVIARQIAPIARKSRNGLQLRPNRELDWKKGNGGENIRPLFSILVYKTRFRSYNPVSRFSLRKPRVSLRNKKGIESYADYKKEDSRRG